MCFADLLDIHASTKSAKEGGWALFQVFLQTNHERVPMS